MLQNLAPLLLAVFILSKQSAAQNLPIVDLGYVLHQASSFNVCSQGDLWMG